MKRALQPKNWESKPPLLRENPYQWTRRVGCSLTLVRRSDVTDELIVVRFLNGEMRENFLQRLKDKAKGIEGMTRTEIQREKLRKGATGW